MSTQPIAKSTDLVQVSSSKLTGSAWRGALIGLIPLGLLTITVAVSILLTTLARQIFTTAGFFAQQQASVTVLIVGLVLTLAVYAIAIWRTLRRVGIWLQKGKIVQSRVALWALGVTALVVVTPILLALILPQHPAP
jgi:hypothetical protein